jgi:hypothetical protein
MNKVYLQRIFSDQRMRKYFDRHLSDEDKAIKHYKGNILVSESFYPLLSIFEVALRNSLNRQLVALFGREDWYEAMAVRSRLNDLNNKVSLAKRHISRRGESITASKVVAELTLGFWVQLFNAEYERILWKSLRRAFPFMPKAERKRHKVSAPLNRIREFRNRVFHHEPVCWRIDRLEQLRRELYSVLMWIDIDLPAFAEPLDKSEEVISKLRSDLN